MLKVNLLVKVASYMMMSLVMMTSGYGGVIAFSYTGGVQTYIVPTGVTSLHVSLWGGGGGGGGSAGSAGAYVTGDLAVNAGDSLVMIVGGGGLGSLNGNNLGGFGGGGAGGTGGLAGNGTRGTSFRGGNGGGGGGLSGIFINSFSASNALVVAGGGGGGGSGSVGSRPTLIAGDGSTLTGGKGGNGGLGGEAASGPILIVGNGKNAGGGAGGGYNGGIAGSNGATGFEGGNGGSAGSLLTLLTNSSLSAAPTNSLFVGTSDPNFRFASGGLGGSTFGRGQNGLIVITEVFSNVSAVPEPSSLGIFSIFGVAILFRRRKP